MTGIHWSLALSVSAWYAVIENIFSNSFLHIPASSDFILNISLILNTNFLWSSLILSLVTSSPKSVVGVTWKLSWMQSENHPWSLGESIASAFMPNSSKMFFSFRFWPEECSSHSWSPSRLHCPKQWKDGINGNTLMVEINNSWLNEEKLQRHHIYTRQFTKTQHITAVL